MSGGGTPKNKKGKNFSWRGGTVAKAVTLSVDNSLDAAAIFVQGDIIANFRKGNRTGRNPSAPGEIPAVVRGRLKASIGVDKPGKLLRRIGSGIGLGKFDPGYAIFLEFGTRNIAQRPWIRPAVSRTRRPVARILGRRVI